MVIEWLKVQIAPGLREKYIQKDEAIWTALLARCSGFLGKEVWIDPNEANVVVLVIRWIDRASWKAVPAKALEETEQRFAQEMGEGTYRIIEEGEFQVRKFPQS